MVKYSEDELDSVFAALADPTRRAVLNTLAEGSVARSPQGVSVTELAAPHGMSLPGFMKHLQVLEDAGLIERTKEGRVVSCELDAAPLKAASAWVSHYEKFWTEKLDSLARYLYQQEELQVWNKQPGKNPSSTSFAPTRSRPRKSGGRGPTRKR
ncbi:MAG TPA: metalloregulator ArsR/SmtB family transcription factor [Burkholderiales bacterium]|nr:metalloregulator ArsR/SmtB family transcription factor [Burkholderiales bacterium]